MIADKQCFGGVLSFCITCLCPLPPIECQFYCVLLGAITGRISQDISLIPFFFFPPPPHLPYSLTHSLTQPLNHSFSHSYYSQLLTCGEPTRGLSGPQPPPSPPSLSHPSFCTLLKSPPPCHGKPYNGSFTTKNTVTSRPGRARGRKRKKEFTLIKKYSEDRCFFLPFSSSTRIT